MSPLLCTCHCHSAAAALSPLPRRRSVAVVVVLGSSSHCHLTVIIVAVGSGRRQSRVGSSPVRVVATSSPGRGRSVTRSRSGRRYVVTRSCRGRVVTSRGRVVAMLGPRHCHFVAVITVAGRHWWCVPGQLRKRDINVRAL
jgi:hypothetical protein